jgi:hypothetical protein
MLQFRWSLDGSSACVSPRAYQPGPQSSVLVLLLSVGLRSLAVDSMIRHGYTWRCWWWTSASAVPLCYLVVMNSKGSSLAWSYEAVRPRPTCTTIRVGTIPWWVPRSLAADAAWERFATYDNLYSCTTQYNLCSDVSVYMNQNLYLVELTFPLACFWNARFRAR